VASGRDPDAAPHCPNCGYNLFGLGALHCPECDRKIETPAELEKARWLADMHAPDRQAVLAERLGAALGGLLMAAGVVFGVLHLCEAEFFYGSFYLELIGGGAIATFVVLYVCRTEKEPLYRPLLILGAVWFLVCFSFWYAS